VVELETRQFKKLSSEEVADYVNVILEAHSEEEETGTEEEAEETESEEMTEEETGEE